MSIVQRAILLASRQLLVTPESVWPPAQYYRYMKRVRDAVPAVEGVTCGDIYTNIEAAIAHVVAALHGAACQSCLHALALSVSPLAEQGPFDGLVGAAARSCGAGAWLTQI